MKRWSPILLMSVLLFALDAGPVAAGGPALLTDEELDRVTAGGVDFSIAVDPNEGLVDFAFNLGSSFGSGSVGLGTPAQVPSTTVFNGGNVNLSNAQFLIDNMVFNLNICVQCRADTIIQKGLGVPITIRAN